MIKNLLRAGVICASAALTVQAHSTEILFAYVGEGYYHADGANIASKISGVSGFNVTQVNLYDSLLGDISAYDQVWVYDLSADADNNIYQTANYSILANWYNSRSASTKNLIADGRIISSADYWINLPTSGGLPSETSWIQNYALQLNARGGGLVLGTDHNVFADGINTINSLIGISNFTGFYYSSPFQAYVDEESPFYLNSLGNCQADATKKCINDNSSTSFVPTGLQANGQFLTPVAWHGSFSDAFSLAAVSSTIGSPSFGTEVPEPGSLLLMLMGLFGLHLSRKRLK
jgi:hypothetical protein